MTSSNPSSNPSTGTSFRNFSLARRGNRMKFVPANSTEFVLKASPDSTTAVSLTWNEPETKPDTYRLERSTDGISFSTVTSAAADVFSYTDTGRTESTEYYYRIVPVLDGADQPASNVASTWTVPSTPTTLAATAVGGTQIDLSWVDVSTGNTAQIIERRTPSGSGSYSLLEKVGATATTYSDTGLTPGQSYEYRVAATNPATLSAYSNTASATPSATPVPSWTLDFSTGTPSGYTLTRASSGRYVDSSGYIASAATNVARLTHNSSGSRLGLLVEEQRANLAQYSAEFENAWWNGGTGTTAAGVTSPTAPDNSTDAAELKETTAASAHYKQRNTIGTTAGTVTWSAYVKKQSRQYVGLQVFTFNNAYAAIFDLNNNAAFSAARSVGTPNGSYGSENVGNGWYRIWVTMTTGGTGTVNTYPSVFLSDRAGFTGTLDGGLPSYTGSTSESVYVWGLQYEAAATPSSYIPTTTASVTRSADIAYVETADVTNWGRPGSFVVEYYKPLEQSGGVVVADDDDAGNAGRLGVEYSAGGPRIVYGTSSAGSGGTDTAGLNKIGWAWNGSGAATRSALNGAALNTSLATSFDPTITDAINLGGNIDWTSLPLTVSGQPNVIIRKVRFWNSQLSAADLNTLTT